MKYVPIFNTALGIGYASTLNAPIENEKPQYPTSPEHAKQYGGRCLACIFVCVPCIYYLFDNACTCPDFCATYCDACTFICCCEKQ